jgi:hypothetical protein
VKTRKYKMYQHWHNPIPKGINAINWLPLLVFSSVNDAERIHYISLRLGHLATLCINSKAMNKHSSKKNRRIVSATFSRV